MHRTVAFHRSSFPCFVLCCCFAANQTGGSSPSGAVIALSVLLSVAVVALVAVLVRGHLAAKRDGRWAPLQSGGGSGP